MLGKRVRVPNAAASVLSAEPAMKRPSRLPFSTSGHWSALLHAIVVVAVVVSWLLARQNAELRDDINRLRMNAFMPHPRMPVPAFRASSITGDSITIAGDNSSVQVLFFFSASCSFCIESTEGWKEIADSINASATGDVIWVSLSGANSTKEYVAQHSIEEPVVLMPDRKVAEMYHANGVPLTVVLDANGRVRFSRLRAIVGQSVVDSVVNASRASAFVDAAPAIPTVRSLGRD